MNRTTLLVACAAWLHAMSVEAGFVYSQNFEGLTLGTINGQDSWFGTANDLVQTNVAIDAKALQVVDFPVGRPSIFAALTHPTNMVQQVDFDFRLPTVVSNFVGTPGLDIQTTIQFRGPIAFHETFFVYKAFTDGSGSVTQNRFELRSRDAGNNFVFTASPNSVQSNVWYHVTLVYNWNTFVLDGLVRVGHTVFWDPAPQSFAGGLDGNVNQIVMGGDGTPPVHFFFDNFTVFVPEPSAAALLGFGGFLLWWRRRT